MHCHSSAGSPHKHRRRKPLSPCCLLANLLGDQVPYNAPVLNGLALGRLRTSSVTYP
ncbi:Uncharacterised protein [Vibrio cholerae]|nr:Uncharacterised protein [Vibrio cholerae]CSI60952.1 Uncharacterised protein [Vibrio cholerae]